ncbi:MAG: Fic family protein [Burkholderiales bacterium]|nr:MAG: Fic family protein [Burkholderiales bacterium]
MTYIYERKDWPEFRWDEPFIGSLLANLRHRQGRLLGRMEAQGFSLREEAVLRTLTSDVIKTSEIEGETLDHDQVRSSLARRLGIEIGALTPAERNVEGIVEVMLDATQKFREPLTEDRLFGWHAALFPTGRSGMSKIIVGDWRDDSDGPMQVISGPFGRERVHFEAVEAKRLRREMKTFLKWYNDGPAMDAVLKAALAHLWFVTIHPFADGNGRIARAIADMSLARSEETAQRFYSMSTQIRTERSMYYKKLEQTQKGDLDITDWLSWFLACLERAFLGAEEILSVVLHKAEFWYTHKDANLNERQKLMLNKLLDGFDGKLTSSKWAKIVRCSQDTASRDIDALIKLGILQRDASGGRSTSYSLKER